MATSLDGNWTVVCLEKNGQPVADAKNLTVTVRNNIATFSDAEKQKAMRFELGANGRIRMTEIEGAGTGTGTGAAAPPAGTAPARPGVAPASPARAETKDGVYVLAKDFFAVSINDPAARPLPGAAPPAGERPRPGTAPPAGERPLPGTAPPAGTQPDTGLGAGRAAMPTKPYCVVILKRSEGGTGAERRPQNDR